MKPLKEEKKKKKHIHKDTLRTKRFIFQMQFAPSLDHQIQKTNFAHH